MNAPFETNMKLKPTPETKYEHIKISGSGHGLTYASSPMEIGKYPSSTILNKPIRCQILEEGSGLTLGARDIEYGDPEINMAASGALKAAMRKHMVRAISQAELEALDMALTKIGRMLTGQPKRDTYVDAATYIAIAGEIALKEKNNGNTSRMGTSPRSTSGTWTDQYDGDTVAQQR